MKPLRNLKKMLKGCSDILRNNYSDLYTLENILPSRMERSPLMSLLELLFSLLQKNENNETIGSEPISIIFMFICSFVNIDISRIVDLTFLGDTSQRAPNCGLGRGYSLKGFGVGSPFLCSYSI